MKTPVTRLDACHDLRVSQSHSTRTHCAHHGEQCRHDARTRSRRGEQITPRLRWDTGRTHVVGRERGYGVCDAPVLDTHCALASEFVRHQDSGNATAVRKGLGVVPWMSVPPDRDQCWGMDNRDRRRPGR